VEKIPDKQNVTDYVSSISMQQLQKSPPKSINGKIWKIAKKKPTILTEKSLKCEKWAVRD
jgi:hypothetical protein